MNKVLLAFASLFACANSLFAAAGVPASFNNTLWVDALRGNDITAQTNSLLQPYRTVTAAVSNLQSGYTIRINPGYYQEKAGIASTTAARTNLGTVPGRSPFGLTNIAVVADPNARIHFTNQGTAIVFWASTNLYVSGGQWIGTKTNPIVAHPDNSFIFNAGICDNVTYENMTIRNCEGFALHIGGDSAHMTRNARVRNCYFYNVGETNWSHAFYGGVPEGGMVQVSGDNSEVTDCYSYRASRGVEIFNSDLAGEADIRIARNRFDECYNKVIFADAGSGFIGISIHDNELKGSSTFTLGIDGAPAILITRGENTRIYNNLVTNYSYAINIEPSGASVNNTVVEGNTLAGGLRAISASNAAGPHGNNIKILNNKIRYFTQYGVALYGTNAVVAYNDFYYANSLITHSAVHFWTTALAGHFNSNNLIFRNYFEGNTNGVKFTQATTGTNLIPRVLDNIFVGNVTNVFTNGGAIAWAVTNLNF